MVRPLVLHRDVGGVEGPADVGHGDVAEHLDLAGLAVDVDLRCRAAELVERRMATERVIRQVGAPALPGADDLAQHRPEGSPHDLGELELP